MHCGYPHPDFLLAVLSYRQQRELEIYSRLEPIGGMIEVSRPAEADEMPGELCEAEASVLFEQIKNSLTKGR